jgi:hypothetical protein
MVEFNGSDFHGLPFLSEWTVSNLGPHFFSRLEIKYFCFSGKVDQMGSAIQDHIRKKT